MEYIGISANYNGTGMVILDSFGDVVDSKVISPKKEDDCYKQSFDIANKLFCEIYNRKDTVIGIGYDVNDSLSNIGLHFVIVNRIQFDLGRKINIMPICSIKHMIVGDMIADKKQLIDMTPNDIKVQFLHFGDGLSE